MYIPKPNQMVDRANLVAFMRQYSFATVISTVAGRYFASHLPLIIQEEHEQVTITGHFARANPHWQSHEQGGEVLVIFHGPHAYISPSQYEAQEAVPTWNYLAVHVYGELRLLEAGAATQATLELLIAAHDEIYRQQWDSLSDKYRSGMQKGIVAFEISVTHLEGKAKLSQNRSLTDQTSVANWLLTHEDGLEQTVGQLMLENINKEKVAV